MKSLLFIASNIGVKNNAQFTRSNEFSKVFQETGYVLRGKSKFRKAIALPSLDLLYMETAANRISVGDFLALLILRAKTDFLVIYIRDVYCEYYKEKFKGLRKKISFIANRISYYLYALLSNCLVFPTIDMGNYFYAKNKFPIRKLSNLPPGVPIPEKNRAFPDFNKKMGILYLGNPNAYDSDFDRFLQFAKMYQDKFIFFVLASNADYYNDIPYIKVELIEHSKIISYLESNNIAFALHARNRNGYDDMTFRIRTMDFISFYLPFITDEHKPIMATLGENYPLFCEMDNEKIYNLINQYNNQEKYTFVYNYLKNILIENTYKKRYEKLKDLYQEYSEIKE